EKYKKTWDAPPAIPRHRSVAKCSRPRAAYRICMARPKTPPGRPSTQWGRCPPPWKTPFATTSKIDRIRLLPSLLLSAGLLEGHTAPSRVAVAPMHSEFWTLHYWVSVPKIRFCNNGDEVRRGPARIRCGPPAAWRDGSERPC